MKILDINNNLVVVDVKQTSYPLKSKSRSNIQGLVGLMLKTLFPRDVILEEFTVPGSRLSVDFFIPNRDLVIEVQGDQHFEHNEFFHGDRKLSTKYGGQQIRDRQKAEWCVNNDFTLVEILEKDTENDIRTKIRNSI